MKKLIRLLRRVRVKFVRSSRRTKTAVICMIAASMVALLALNIAIDGIIDYTEAKRKQAAQLEYENQQKQEDIDNLGSAGSVEDIAQGELDMVPGDAIVIQPGQ